MATDLVYKSNPKHREPWQPGRKGTLCPKSVWNEAQRLLDESVPIGDKRYTTYDGLAYEAQDSKDGTWHGFPVGWEKINGSLRRQWIKERKVKRRDVKRFWSNEDVSDVFQDP